MNNRVLIAFATVLATTLAGFAFAHANLKSATPKDHAHLKTAPKTVTLVMKEAVETKVSKFGVYFMPAESMMKNGKPMTSSQMDDVVEANFKKLLNRKTDGADRVDAGLAGTPTRSSTITIALKPNLKPGVYIIAWRALSVDGHTVSDAIHFHVDSMKM